ncbi:MAG TPA: multicopper oxidase family protein [bacterium]|nr:multicopper oxidase family protein [bacterium]
MRSATLVLLLGSVSILSVACGPKKSAPVLPASCDVPWITANQSSAGVVDVNLTAAETDWDPGTGVPIHGLAYNGIVPGPVIPITAGETLRVHFTNALSVEGTTVHWHGVRIAWAMDGVPGLTQDAILPGQTFVYQFTVPDPGFYWYHPHMQTAKDIERGLYGRIISRDPAEPVVDCDMPIALDDVLLGADGQVVAPSLPNRAHGNLGNLLLANGRIDTRVPISKGGHTLLRLVNAANARTFDLSIEGHSMRVVGTDQGWLPVPYTTDRLVMAGGERYEVLVDGTGEPGHEYRVISHSHLDDPMELDPLPGDRPIFTLVYDQQQKNEPVPSFPPPAIPAWTPGPVAHKYVLNDIMQANGGMISTIDGKSYPNVPMVMFSGAGEPVTLQIENDASGMHPMHFHGERLLVVARNGTTQLNPGWKDTVMVAPHETVTLMSMFDNPGSWMFHCHILEHAEDGMMAMFMAN